MTQCAVVQIESRDGIRRVEVNGRDLWALGLLVEAGPIGCTPIGNPAPRWSGYVHNLRKVGLEIESIHEAHKGVFPGVHARYVLHSNVRIEWISEPEPVA